MHTITTRTPTAMEQQIIAAQAKPEVVSWGCLVVAAGIIPGLLLGKLGGWLGGFISEDASNYGQWIGWLLSAVLLVSALVMYFPYERRLRRLAGRDVQQGIVQEIHVVESRVIEIGCITNHEPLLAFEIDDNKILLLQGQWLRDAETYGADDLEGDPYEEFINGLPAPHSFPSSEFTVSRLPSSGRVLGICVGGNYSAPQAVVWALKPEYEFGDSELLEGSLDDVDGVLARAHERRRRKSVEEVG